jgi:hypothetical protein
MPAVTDTSHEDQDAFISGETRYMFIGGKLFGTETALSPDSSREVGRKGKGTGIPVLHYVIKHYDMRCMREWRYSSTFLYLATRRR